MYLEHANITVSNIDKTIRFLQTAFPEFEVRGYGETKSEGVTRKWLHLGTDETYVALEQTSADDEGSRRRYRDVGVNHIGFVVENIDEVVGKLEEAGYKQSIGVDPHPYRKRAYYFDDDLNEYEFIEYLSDDPAKRNDYEL